MNSMLTRKNRRSKRIRKGGKYEPDAPVVLELPVDDPIIVFSEGIKQQLIEKMKMKYDKLGWFRKNVVASPPGWFASKSRFLVTPDISTILPLISEKLNKHGLRVKRTLTPSDYTIELEYANAGNKPVKSDFVIHQENEGDIDGVRVLTVFLDMDCDGGELVFYSPDEEKIESFEGKTNSKMKKIIMYDGELYNKPEPITNGKRVVITYLIREAK